MSTCFRQIEKEHPGGRIPRALSRKLRRLAGEQKRSISSVLTEALARGMGEDPAEFGLTLTQEHTSEHQA